ncbi:MAG: restriction endonuclease subunit S [Pseudomonadota bacterium]
MAGDWTETTVGEAFEIGPSRTLKRGDVAPFIPMDALPVHARAFERIDYREFTGSGTRFKNGDTLIARITPCLENGKTAYVAGLPDSSVGHGSTEYIVLPGRESLSDGLYGYYLARSPDFRRYAIGHMEGTSGRQRVPSTAIEKYVLALPPLPEQRAIAHILGTLDDKIENLHRQNETLEAMARVLFKDWFVDFGPVRAKLEGRWRRGESLPGLPAHLYDLFPDRLVESELGEIPEGWEVQPFSETVEVIGGGTPKTSVSEYWGGDIPWFSVIDAPSLADIWVVDTEKKVTQKGIEASSTKVLPVGTTIISARGTVGRLALVGVPMAMNQSCYGLQSKRGAKGFYTYFATRTLVSVLQQRAHRSVFDTITRDTLAGIAVIMPPDRVVDEFEQLAEPLLRRIHKSLLQSRTLAALRDALLPKLISGELRIMDAEKFLESRGGTPCH